MPNWVKNRITYGNDACRQWIETNMINEQGEFDFEKVLPMPEILKHTRSGFRKFDGVEHCVWYSGLDGERPFTQDEQTELIEKYGYLDWYEWSIANWGTKWNTGRTVCDSGAVEFETAWSFPEGVFNKMLELMPVEAKNFVWEYADENIGYNLGSISVNDGVPVEQEISEPRRFAVELRGYDYDQWLAEMERYYNE